MYKCAKNAKKITYCICERKKTYTSGGYGIAALRIAVAFLSRLAVLLFILPFGLDKGTIVIIQHVGMIDYLLIGRE